jgi:MSHA biogenesis protein MshJ
MIRKQFESLQTRVDALSLRERAIIFIAVAAILFLIWDTLFMTPLDRKQRDLVKQLQTIRAEITALDDQALAIMSEHNVDPNRAEREQLSQLDEQLSHTSEQINEMIQGLIEPRQMAQIIESVLKQQHGLDFIHLENLGSESLLDVKDDKGNGDAQGIFKHTLRIELQGSYTQAIDYLRALETLPWQFRWDEVKITMRDYPRADIVITVHTISLTEGWIGV